MADLLTILLMTAPQLFPSVPGSVNAATSARPPAVVLETVEVEADRYRVEGADEKGNWLTLTADGGVTISLLGTASSGPVKLNLAAGTVTVDRLASVVTAERGVSATFQAGSATGQRLVFKFDKDEPVLSIAGFETQAYGLHFSGESIFYSPRQSRLFNVDFTPCEGERPDVAIHADRIILDAGRSLSASGVTVRLFGRRVARVPGLDYDLTTGRPAARSLLPIVRPSWTKVSGLGVDQPIPVAPGLEAEIGYATHIGFRGGLYYRPIGTDYRIVANVKQEEPVTNDHPVLVSRLPEVGVRFGPGRRWDAAAGYYRQEDGGPSAGRAMLTWKQQWNTRRDGSGWRYAVEASAYAYTTGDAYGAAFVEAVYREGNRDKYWQLGARPWFDAGETPFTWDQAPARMVVLAGGRVPVGSYRVGLDVEYELRADSFYDVVGSLARKYRCVEPEISFSTRRQSVNFSLHIPFGELTGPTKK